MFVFCVNIFKKKYLDGTSYKQLFVPEQDIQASFSGTQAGALLQK